MGSTLVILSSFTKFTTLTNANNYEILPLCEERRNQSRAALVRQCVRLFPHMGMLRRVWNSAYRCTVLTNYTRGLLLEVLV